MYAMQKPDLDCNVLTVQRTSADMLCERLIKEQWWIYPNPDEDKFSKVFARVNHAGYLVVGQDLDTRIVCIQDGLFTLSDHGCADAVRFDDPRIIVFLPQKR